MCVSDGGVSFTGFREGCLDQLAFDSMIPLYKLKEYANMVSLSVFHTGGGGDLGFPTT